MFDNKKQSIFKPNVIKMDGKTISEEIMSKYTCVYNSVKPKLVIVSVNTKGANGVYIKNKLKACELCDIETELSVKPENITREEMYDYIESLNKDKTVTGIIIQQPLPNHLKGVEQYIIPEKDVDGFTEVNIGKTLIGNKEDDLIACTPKGIITLFDKYDINLSGKKVCILGRSNIVGKPLIGLLLQRNATIISCNSYTEEHILKNLTTQSDIIISAIGKPKYIDSSFITGRCECIIDVGINRDENGKLCGDCDMESIEEYWNIYGGIHYITPVPGGVGPMTVASLIQNVYISFNKLMEE